MTVRMGYVYSFILNATRMRLFCICDLSCSGARQRPGFASRAFATFTLVAAGI